MQKYFCLWRCRAFAFFSPLLLLCELVTFLLSYMSTCGNAMNNDSLIERYIREIYNMKLLIKKNFLTVHISILLMLLQKLFPF